MDQVRLRRAVERVLRPPDESIRRLGIRTKPDSAKSETTILAFRYADGIICAADRQVTEGRSILSQEYEKVFKISSNSILLGSGSVVCLQEVCREMQYRCKDFEEQHGVPISIHGQVNFLSALCKNFDENASFDGIMAGVNRDGRHHLFLVDDDGSILPFDPFLARGSGSDSATSVLHVLWGSYWTNGLTLAKGIELAVLTIGIAAVYDSGSSDPRVATPTVAVIDSEARFVPKNVVAAAYESLLRKEDEQYRLIARDLQYERSPEEDEP